MNFAQAIQERAAAATAAAAEAASVAAVQAAALTEKVSEWDMGFDEKAATSTIAAAAPASQRKKPARAGAFSIGGDERQSNRGAPNAPPPENGARKPP
eukprot:CAMPEP_0202753462 /NCGR_PEP_ID=MMETSP1388-20130828/13599_1 /ASSEMBLY_ACC=CAM_ASM_000864 /TAXON_ID=37098 /ORGANISM="Isochrysis sp, Strain CCMP1244" /LENGTH=97 /DNA_ID=CAMNT_0049421207 /DNA_START=24 /DNA_END=314 /DNA_ORIENTATION=-